MKIEIPPALYQICESCSQNRWSNKKKGVYGRGLINNVDDPCRAERVGLLGEAALAQYINRKVDYKYKEGGNPFDFSLNNCKIDIKTAAKSYGCGLIRAKNQYGKSIELTSDIYAFGYIEKDNRKDKEATVILKGWLQKAEIEKCPIVPARIGSHYNYQIEYGQLKPIEELRKIGSKDKEFTETEKEFQIRKTETDKSGIHDGAVSA